MRTRQRLVLMPNQNEAGAKIKQLDNSGLIVCLDYASQNSHYLREDHNENDADANFNDTARSVVYLLLQYSVVSNAAKIFFDCESDHPRPP